MIKYEPRPKPVENPAAGWEEAAAEAKAKEEKAEPKKPTANTP